jgi:predicted membrane protein
MKNSILKTIVGGMFFGTLLFFTPTFIIFFFAALLFMKMLFFRSTKGGFRQKQIAYAERIRAMSELEFENFKQSFSGNCRSNQASIS